MVISFFRFGKFSSVILLKIFAGPLCWKSSLSSIPIILRFGLHLCPGIPGCFGLGSFCILHFLWLLCQCFLWYLQSLWFSLLYLVFCWWCLLASMAPDLFPRFSNSKVVSLCDFFIISISIFRSWMVLFISFASLIVFFCNSSRKFCLLPAYLCSPVFI